MCPFNNMYLTPSAPYPSFDLTPWPLLGPQAPGGFSYEAGPPPNRPWRIFWQYIVTPYDPSIMVHLN